MARDIPRGLLNILESPRKTTISRLKLVGLLHENDWGTYYYDAYFSDVLEILNFAFKDGDTEDKKIYVISTRHDMSLIIDNIANDTSIANNLKNNIIDNYINLTKAFDLDEETICLLLNPNKQKIIIFFKENTYDVYTNEIVTALLKLLLSVGLSSNEPELKELINTDASEEKWLDYYINKYRLDPFLTLKMLKNDIEMIELQKQLKTNKNNMADLLVKLESYSIEINRLQEEIATLPEVTKEETNYYNMLKGIKGLEYLELKQLSGNRTDLVFTVKIPAQIDEEFLNKRIIRDEKLFKFFQNLAQGNITIYMVQCVGVRISSSGTPYVAETPSNISDLYNQPIYSNPHLSQYNCFGSSAEEILKAFSAQNYYALALTIIRTVSQINLTDSAVVNTFRDIYFRNGDIIIETHHGEQMTYNRYLFEEKMDNSEEEL